MPRLLKGMSLEVDSFHLSTPDTQLEDDAASVSLGVGLSLLQLAAAVDTRAQHPSG